MPCLRSRGRALLFMTAGALTLMLFFVASSTRAGHRGNPNPGILPPHASGCGQSYADWGDQWWRWAMSFPADSNPMVDDTGQFGAQGQEGRVWFLAGINGAVGTVERSITVPNGTKLFFPIINNLWINLPELGDDPWSAEQEAFARSVIADAIDTATGISCTIDGEEVLAIDDPLATPYRVVTDVPFEDIYLPENDVWGLNVDPFNLPEGVYGPCVADGIYLMVAPLKPGEHTIHFTAGAMDVTYHITVE